MNFTIKQLEQVEALMEQGSYVNAARKLFVTPSALNQAIKQLEDMLDVRLFEKKAKRIVPTVYGKQFYQRSHKVLLEMRHFETGVSNLVKSDHKELNIGMGPFPADYMLGDLISAMRLKHPKLNVNISIEYPVDLFKKLQDGALDAMVGDTRIVPADSGYAVHRLNDFPLCVVCDKEHPLALEDSCDLDDVLEYPILSSRIPHVILKSFSLKSPEYQKFINVAQNMYVDCLHWKPMKDIISSSATVGIGVFPLFKEELEQGKFKCLAVFDELMIKNGVVVSSNCPVTAEMKTLIDESSMLSGFLGSQWQAFHASNRSSKIS